jgi:hypothetical protein
MGFLRCIEILIIFERIFKHSKISLKNYLCNLELLYFGIRIYKPLIFKNIERQSLSELLCVDAGRNLKSCLHRTSFDLIVERESKTIYITYINDVKVDFVKVPYPKLFPVKLEEAIRMLDVRDISS